MEKLRSFERRCLRSCLRKKRSESSNFQRHISNKKIYDLANLPRIDLFMIGLIRNHYVQAAKITNNSLIFGCLYPNELYYEKTMQTGYIPPEAFIYLDSKGYIQDRLTKVPLIYHVKRHKANKKITYPAFSHIRDPELNIKYSTALPDRDINDKRFLNTKVYWWLENDWL